MYSPPAFLVISKLFESGILNVEITKPITPKIKAPIRHTKELLVLIPAKSKKAYIISANIIPIIPKMIVTISAFVENM